jgi:hypothetical protein
VTRWQALRVWSRLPRAWTRTARRRRLAFVGACAPGVLMSVLGPELRHDPRWLGLGLALILLAVLARRLSEPRFRVWDAGEALPAVSFEEPCHDRQS